MAKPSHVSTGIPPKPPALGNAATAEELRTSLREMARYEQQLAIYQQQTLGSFRDAINYILDQLP